LPGGVRERYFIDYAVASRTWRGTIAVGARLPDPSIASECIAIGFTAKGQEVWDNIGPVRVECLGAPPYPNQMLPRVLGIVRPQKQTPVTVPEITYLQGDATRPRGGGAQIIAQVVNDSAFTWGAGFSLAVRQKWPEAQREFRVWAEQRNLRLGNVHFGRVTDHLTVVSMIAQHGFGPSPKLRIRYMALKACLEQMAKHAAERNATIHMPKIGSGQAGGSWNIIREIVQETVSNRGVRVFVYDLPSGPGASHPQKAFEFQ
jgi:O-acetyl-ADP-ribose deacetylase (regulator of RNase III)